MTRKQRLFIRILLITLIFSGTTVALANELLEGEHCTIEADTVIEGDAFVFCGELIVEGRVEGNIIGAANLAVISGEIGGSIYLVGGELDLFGTVGKDVHFVGVVLRLEETARFEHERGGVLSGNLSNTITPGAVVPGTVTNLGYQLVINGEVGGVTFWGSALNIDGSVNGDVTATVGSADSDGSSSQIETLLLPFPFTVTLVDPGFVLGEDGFIRGTLDYSGTTRGIEDGQVGEVIFRSTTIEPIVIGAPVEESARSLQIYAGNILSEFATLGLIGGFFLIIAPGPMQAPLRSLQTRPLSTLGVGLLSFILSFPIVLIIALFSLFIVFVLSLLPLDSFVLFGGVVLGLANIGGASIFYFTAIYVARIIFAFALGRLIVHLLLNDDGSLRFQLISLLLGIFIVAFIGAIPVIGPGFNALALFLGLGAILTVLQNAINRFRAVGLSVSAIANGYSSAAKERLPLLPARTGRTEDDDMPDFAAPVIEDRSPDEIGLDDLPEGFDWWGEDDPR